MRSIEQWKCDNLGMCHFGTRPSNAFYPPYNPATYPPANAPLPPTAVQPALPGVAPPMFVGPTPMNVPPSVSTPYPPGAPSVPASAGLRYGIPQTYSQPTKQTCQQPR
ncbi:MAG: hypothetical protein NTY42_01085 [Planctomycetota bacterium]|nr:hypothetical protein [Planctomycetota bacterium]